MASLYIVSTPIGNLADITYRAVDTLKTVDLVLCEDTRVTGKLLTYYGIETKSMSYHANSSLKKLDVILDMLREGKNLALVSDAGTPIISDPGILLVQAVVAELPDVHIVPIPGASALLAAIVSSGVNCSEFHFFGFIPHKKGRETLFKKLVTLEYTAVMYESPHRIEKTLESLAQYLDSDRQVVIARELTKMYEEVFRGSPDEVKDYFKTNNDKVRGEFVVIVSPCKIR